MNNLNNYIIEKLHISKNSFIITTDYLLHSIMDIIKPNYAKDDIEEIIEAWLSDYDKLLVLHIHQGDSEEWEKVNNYHGIHIEEENIVKLNALVNKSDKATAYESPFNNIRKIILSDKLLTIFISGLYTIVFEKD